MNVFARQTERSSKFLAETGMSMSVSDGEVLCTGCWDASNHDCHKDNNIPKGEQVWYTKPSYYYGESDAYCRRHAFEHARIGETWYAAVKRTRPWVGLDYQVIKKKPRSYVNAA